MADYVDHFEAVYTNTLAYAREHNELDSYNESRNLNVSCQDAINAAIAESRHDTHFYKMSDAVKAVVNGHGLERTQLILAKIVQSADWDGRYSRQNHAWAQSFEIPQGMQNIYSNTHPCLLDGFLNKLREKAPTLETARQPSGAKQNMPKKKEQER